MMVDVPGFPTATAGIVSGVVVVVVVVTERIGGGGGGAETVCDSGPAAQPASRPKTPKKVMIDKYCLIAWTEAELLWGLKVFIFIAPDYTPGSSISMGCSTEKYQRRLPFCVKKLKPIIPPCQIFVRPAMRNS
jgi:hypothetical protein